MVTDQQVRRLMRVMKSKSTKAIAALKVGMNRKTARLSGRYSFCFFAFHE